jgi:hypothetical protein
MPSAISHFDNDGATQLSSQVWPDAFAGVTQTPRKFAIENTGDRILIAAFNVSITEVGTNDGDTMLQIALDTSGTLSKPYNVAAALTAAGAGGSWGSTGLRYFRITAYNATGATVGSTEISIDVDVVSKKVVLTWTEIVGATGYKIYRTTSSGVYTPTALRTTIVGSSTTTFTDDGAALSAGALPSDNTTGGVGPTYGTAPTFDIVSLSLGPLAIHQQKFYWVQRVIAAGVSEAGNPRLAALRFSESA